MRLSSEERGSHHQAIRNLHQKFKKIKRTWKHLTVDQDQYPLQLLESGRVLQNFKRQTQTRVFSKGEEKNLHFWEWDFLYGCTVKVPPYKKLKPGQQEVKKCTVLWYVYNVLWYVVIPVLWYFFLYSVGIPCTLVGGAFFDLFWVSITLLLIK